MILWMLHQRIDTLCSNATGTNVELQDRTAKRDKNSISSV